MLYPLTPYDYKLKAFVILTVAIRPEVHNKLWPLEFRKYAKNNTFSPYLLQKHAEAESKAN